MRVCVCVYPLEVSSVVSSYLVGRKFGALKKKPKIRTNTLFIALEVGGEKFCYYAKLYHLNSFVWLGSLYGYFLCWPLVKAVVL